MCAYGDDPPGRSGRRVLVIVCDSLGIGAAPDAERYGDLGANTLGHVAEHVGGLDLPLLERWGIGNLAAVQGVGAAPTPAAVVTRLTPRGAGKDSITGHWELMGCRTRTPFPTYPDGFPADIIGTFERKIGRPVLGNRPASGTEIIEELFREHEATGGPIVYTSADSVFQVAAHVEVVDPETLYAWCRAARELLTGDHAVGRVIARPFCGSAGALRRTAGRRDFTLPPPCRTACEELQDAGVRVRALGKIDDLFSGRGIDVAVHTGNNDATLAALQETLTAEREVAEFVFVNLVDFDQQFGHRNDPEGYARALESFDAALTGLCSSLSHRDVVFVTGDHGTDPTRTETTDHTREYVPCIAWTPGLARGTVLEDRPTFGALGATLLDLLGVDAALQGGGRSFATALKSH